LATVERCSTATLVRRFHGFADVRRYLGDLQHRPEAAIFMARRGARCVGFAEAVLCEDGIAETAMLVEDAEQNRGVGSTLLPFVIALALRQGARVVRAELLEEHGYLLPALGRFGPLTVQRHRDGLVVDLKVS
jgi:GNAT superfamily N-acetyltransferase